MNTVDEFVLILVVVDNGLVLIRYALNLILRCLNPCYSGQWSRTLLIQIIIIMETRVLILVIVDNGLVPLLLFLWLQVLLS